MDTTIIDDLSGDLTIDTSEAKELIKKNGWDVASKVLGYNTLDYDNLQLAGRMAITSLKERIGTSLTNYLKIMKPRMKEDIHDFISSHVNILQDMIDEREKDDLEYDWFSANSLIRTYLTKVDGQPCETPRQLWMRVAVTLFYKKGIVHVKKVFNQLCDGYYIMASPTLFNAGMKSAQMSSCFLLTMEDSIESIYDTLKDSAIISKNMGANGIDLSRVRDGKIGLDGKTNGVVPWVLLYNFSTRAVNQNGKRKGATTLYIRLHHINVFEFCECSLKTGDPYARGHDLNYALWTPWLFWKRVNNDEDWTLFCPADTKDLNDIWGIEWIKRYLEYEKDKTIRHKTVKARKLLEHFINIQRKSGMPYILHGDTINMKCNQKNLGYIRCSNLCLEITEYTSDEEIPSCNLASISLRKFVMKKYDLNSTNIYSELRKSYNFTMLGRITRQLVSNLNQVIDENNYHNPKIKLSNNRHKPIGIGVSGLVDALHMLDIPFHDPKNPLSPYPVTKVLNKLIFAAMYWNALAQSVELAIQYGKYETFYGSPLSKGKLQFDLWKEEYNLLKEHDLIDNRYRKKEDDQEINPIEWDQEEFILSNGDVISPTWGDLKRAIIKYGVRNSLLIALMPTATSSQPLRNAETVEAHQSNIYSRKIMNGAYPVLNRHLVNDLKEINLWSKNTIQLMQADEGSIRKLKDYIKIYPEKYPEFDKSNLDRLSWLIEKYKTMWELSMFVFLDMAADRGRYVCQSQSTNIYLDDPSDAQLITVHTYGNSIGLKTGMYYLREKAARPPIQITVDPDIFNFIPSDLSDTYEIHTNHEELVKQHPETRRSTIKKQVICNDDVCIACQ